MRVEVLLHNLDIKRPSCNVWLGWEMFLAALNTGHVASLLCPHSWQSRPVQTPHFLLSRIYANGTSRRWIATNHDSSFKTYMKVFLEKVMIIFVDE